MKSSNYIREKHPIIIRAIALWRIVTCRNFILIDFKEIQDKYKGKGRKVRPLYRSDYDAESELMTLEAAIDMKLKSGR